jgi:hypothetical protein
MGCPSCGHVTTGMNGFEVRAEVLQARAGSGLVETRVESRKVKQWLHWSLRRAVCGLVEML